MDAFGLSPKVTGTIRQILADFPEVERAVIYGSRAKGTHKPGSDIDLTLFGDRLTSDIRARIAVRLDGSPIPHTVDLSLYAELNHVKLREHIDRVGVVFYERGGGGERSGTAGLKKGWEGKTIGDLCKVIAGQSPEGKFYNSEGKGLPFYQGKKDFGEKFIGVPSTWTTQAKKIARKGDILMSVRAPVGPVNFATEDVCIGRGLAAIRSKPELNHDFLFYQLLHLQPEIAGKEGAVFASINKAEIEALPLAYAPLAEQQRIVGVLDEAFAGLATAKANAEKNLQNARALFESHLQSVFAEMWRNSEIAMLADLATDITDGDHLPPPKSSTGVPFITIGNIMKETRQIDFGDTFAVPRTYYDALKPHKKPRSGDVLYTVTGSFGIPVPVPDGLEFCFQRHIGLIRPKPETSSSWLYYLLLSPQMFKQANDGATGTAQRTVSLKLLRSFRVPKVALAKQKEAVEKLDDMSATTQRLAAIYSRKLAALDALKKSLLHQAFAGEL